MYNKIGEINAWLLRNKESYFQIEKKWKCNICPTDKGIPCICLEPEGEYTFMAMYEELEKIVKYHEREEYYAEQLNKYYECQNSEINLKIWIEKNSDHPPKIRTVS